MPATTICGPHRASIVGPRDQTVAALKLHPEYIAKSYFPGRLINAVGLRTVGSRGVVLEPEQVSRGPQKQARPGRLAEPVVCLE